MAFSDSNILKFYAGDIFGAKFASAGAMAQPTNPVAQMDARNQTVQQAAAQAALPVGQPTNPMWWLGIVVILFLFMWVVNRYGSEGNSFGNIKLTAYNALVLSWMPIVGIVFWKMVFSRIRVPIATDLVLSV